MKSLKLFIQNTLARVVERAPVTLYQRQAPLVAAGLLDAVSGYGPGSGVKATPRSVAVLLIALLATDTPSDTTAVATFAKLKSSSGKCGLTGESTLVDALTAILSMDTLPREVWLQADRSRNRVVITYSDAGAPVGFSESAFTKGGKFPPTVSGLQTHMAMYKGLHAISKALKG